MHIREYYQRQSRYKKPLFMIYVTLLAIYLIAWIVLSFAISFTLGDHVAAAIVFAYLNAWVPCWFKVEPTEEEIEAEREECRRMLAEYDKKYNSRKQGKKN